MGMRGELWGVGESDESRGLILAWRDGEELAAIFAGEVSPHEGSCIEKDSCRVSGPQGWCDGGQGC